MGSWIKRNSFHQQHRVRFTAVQSPTTYFTSTSEPQNPSINVFERHKIRRLTEFNTLELRTVWSGVS